MHATAIRHALLSLAAVCLLGVDTASAQYVYRNPDGFGYPGYNSYYPLNWGGGATVAGSYATGMGNLIQAQGAYNQATAQASVVAQQAYSMALDNRLKSQQAYYELQRVNREQAAAKKQRDSEIWAKNVPPPKRPRLKPSQLDPVTGEITWDPLLMAPEFEAYRNRLQALFTERAKDPASVSYFQVSQITGPMRDFLDTKITEYPTNVFFSARHFIDAVAQESRFSGLEATPTAQSSNAPPGAQPPRS
jgi:hypothetical protein